jgi:uncharacterized membrane protein (UPF0136 family)
MAILADMGASLLVIFNGLRLLRAKKPFALIPDSLRGMGAPEKTGAF